mmetsp:Transcript_15839/g.24653  ORF Transcript_15839/g.24653 Transcript_15839/m.24653 type:complete len:344 (-) Transcript_15839:81-1112(-)
MTLRLVTFLFSFGLFISQVVGFLPFTPPVSVKRSFFLRAAASVPFNEGNVTVYRTFDDQDEQEVKESYTLSYKIARPMSLSSRQAAPIVVLHGGPSVPSNYLYPLVDAIPYRSIIFYDQLGCGQSSEPQDINAYSIDKAIDDLEILLKKIGARRFHLYGQSFGGILAFEYLKRVAERNNKIEGEGCLSVILSSTPTNVKLVEEEAHRLHSQIKNENPEEEDESVVAEAFRQEHQCRTPEMPLPLQEAYQNAGTVWRGTDAIRDYVAKAVAQEETARMPSAMVLRGEHDFVTEVCVEGWSSKTDPLFNHKFVRSKTVEGCSHHGLLENEKMYGEMIDNYFAEYD